MGTALESVNEKLLNSSGSPVNSYMKAFWIPNIFIIGCIAWLSLQRILWACILTITKEKHRGEQDKKDEGVDRRRFTFLFWKQDYRGI